MFEAPEPKKGLDMDLKLLPARRIDLGYLVPSGGVVAELGVACGNFSSALLNHHPHLGKLYAIDKWNDERHPAHEETVARNNLRDPRAIVIRQTFEEAAKNEILENICFDLIYVDGYAHTGQDSGATLAHWWPKLKPGGIFAGHDYDTAWPLTIKAVNEFAKNHRLTIHSIKEIPFNSWWLSKPVNYLATM
ncbi:class I SAM-dependent methyltransferase [Prosthecobacter vanneervenii]|uniref:Putative O-methyltransferase YrrM n=1 Tax=Prosthecobacter vanneervenii TaxID=48466 RepID=A0A7W8DN59_9BACT|nr:class I SAM-dependent methyltransferase [Prosthecobacter vanneervenii]MBB5035556.1 putative O-methyltransferase YrrM [Prosthecobacter vanneervenii]